ncbi:asparaginase [Aliiruegeria sabulilitoris]|uniref:asparaginase n=1 Tax=Aliiruegeria sabulilitoris TaxID=1510458 RepID=UPI00082D5A15|nr:asparaginase [Aliiruegeria sabulilitoris]NDR55405.1 asparaginase [Pseudoruegeria sp. M32A2M]
MSILLIHTGGTIGMDRTEDGFAPRIGVVEGEVQRLLDDGRVTTPVKVCRLDPLIDSAQATPRDWTRVARTIFEARDDFDSFVVTHGTDTLAYTAGALCLSLPGLRKAVIVTGSMLPLTVEGNDGQKNLFDALSVVRDAAPGVQVQFAGHLLHGARIRKSHSHAFDAFRDVPSAEPPVVAARTPGLIELREQNVGMLSVTPGPSADLVGFAAENCDGLVLRCFGSGTAPDTPELRAALARAYQKQVPVVAVSQCPEGGMRLGTYAAGKVMRDTGVVDGRDMSPEMAFAKMQFSLTKFTDFEARRAYLAASQCGEMTT